MSKDGKRQIEVELRSRFSKKKHDELLRFLGENAKDLGEDDKDVYFFIQPDKLIKVTNNISKRTAKLTLKLNKIGKGSGFEEIEISISSADVAKAVKFLGILGYREVQRSFQKRHNYFYDGAELALKYSKTWGYHLELEMLVSSGKDIKRAEAKLLDIGEKLRIRIMTDAELATFTAKKDKEYRKHKKMILSYGI